MNVAFSIHSNHLRAHCNQYTSECNISPHSYLIKVRALPERVEWKAQTSQITQKSLAFFDGSSHLSPTSARFSETMFTESGHFSQIPSHNYIRERKSNLDAVESSTNTVSSHSFDLVNLFPSIIFNFSLPSLQVT